MDQHPSNVQEQDYQIIQNMDLKESTAVKRTVFSPRVVLIVFFVAFFLIISYVVVMDKNNIGSNLRNILLFNRTLSREEMLMKAKKNCQGLAPTTNYRQTVSNTDKLRYEIIDKLGNKFKPGMISISEEVPDTNNCMVVWLLNAEGRGYAGYRNANGNIKVSKASYPKEMLNVRDNQI